jgi:hypothetical protein
LATIDDNCKTLKRERNFKIYLNNPSMRAAFFAPVKATDASRIGVLAECAVFSQWQHAKMFGNLRYARWKNEGEVDIVYLAQESQKPNWLGEIKWSDRLNDHEWEETRHMSHLLRKHPQARDSIFTTRTIEKEIVLENRRIKIYPTAAYCYIVGRNITRPLWQPPLVVEEDSATEDQDE